MFVKSSLITCEFWNCNWRVASVNWGFDGHNCIFTWQHVMEPVKQNLFKTVQMAEWQPYWTVEDMFGSVLLNFIFNFRTKFWFITYMYSVVLCSFNKAAEILFYAINIIKTFMIFILGTRQKDSWSNGWTRERRWESTNIKKRNSQGWCSVDETGLKFTHLFSLTIIIQRKHLE